jgi:phosphopantothenate-cysteine ligase/phosphopantothenoylcysteine decarboxylase/phosphopantothenate--cysteine ligase
MAARRHFLVTAGNTREKIDRVRDWGNIFTGQTGLDIALAMLEAGDVTLLTSNRQHAASYDGYTAAGGGMLGVETFGEIAELERLLEERLTGGAIDAVFMSAAVSDYRPDGTFRVVQRQVDPADATREIWTVENVQAGKVKSDHGTIAILGTATPKLIDMFRTRWHYAGVLVKFKLEVGISAEQLIAIAQASRTASGADLIVANTLEMVQGHTAGATTPGAYIVGTDLCQRIDRAELAPRLRELVVELLAARE